MKKDFKKWHDKKEIINGSVGTALFHEREVWWCVLGANVGYEQDGSQEDFERPVIILRKFNLDACLIIPLTAKLKKGKFYFTVGMIDGRNAVAILSQVRFIDRKRLVNKICMLERNIFLNLIRAVIKISINGDP